MDEINQGDRMAEKWMQKAFDAHPGRLHRALGVPEGEKIPESKMEGAAHSKDPHMRQMANLAAKGKRYGGGGRHKGRSKGR